MPLKAGQPLPLTDVGSGLRLVCFYKTECPTCALTFPYWLRMQEAYAVAGLRIVTLAQNTRAEVDDFLHGRRPGFDVGLDDDPYRASNQMRIEVTPTVFLVDADGTIVRVIEAWNRQDYETLGIDVAGRLGVAEVPLFTADDKVPVRQFG